MTLELREILVMLSINFFVDTVSPYPLCASYPTECKQELLRKIRVIAKPISYRIAENFVGPNFCRSSQNGFSWDKIITDAFIHVRNSAAKVVFVGKFFAN